MLKSIHIENFAIVDEANVSFDAGLNVITGETGVGKSLIVDALNIALGERAFKDLIREGYPTAVVEAVFEVKSEALSKLREMEIDHPVITVKREIRLQGTSKVWINGQSRTVQELKSLGDRLVDLHGQHEHQFLLNEEHHIDFLDQFAETKDQLAAVDAAYHELIQVERELQERERSEHNRQEQMQLYAFQLQELNDINPGAGELEALEKERRILENAISINELAVALQEQADGQDNSALRHLNKIIGQLEGLSSYTDTAAAFLPEALAARVSIQSIADFAAEYAAEIQADPRRLDEVESRIKVLNRICQKYNKEYDELLEYWEMIQRRLDQQDDPEWGKAQLIQKVHEKRRRYSENCIQLSESRRSEALVLEQAIVEKLGRMGIPQARFEITIDREMTNHGNAEVDGERYWGDRSGMDKVAFWMQANPGEPLRPLARIASGGEISRIMLAIKSSMSGRDGIGTVIFDEIDTGISGRIARVVGEELKQLGRHHQLISITHLPQIASLADTHFRVEKQYVNGRTVTRVKRLSADERVSEIASLIGDGAPGEAAKKAAQELLQN